MMKETSIPDDKSNANPSIDTAQTFVTANETYESEVPLMKEKIHITHLQRQEASSTAAEENSLLSFSPLSFISSAFTSCLMKRSPRPYEHDDDDDDDDDYDTDESFFETDQESQEFDDDEDDRNNEMEEEDIESVDENNTTNDTIATEDTVQTENLTDVPLPVGSKSPAVAVEDEMIHDNVAEEKKCEDVLLKEDHTSSNSLDEQTTPKGKRWSVSAPSVDLSGSWKLVETPTFKQEYDQYLTALGFNYFTRSIALQVIFQTAEEINQKDDGRSLQCIGINPKGTWDRTFFASSGLAQDRDSKMVEEEEDYVHERHPIQTAEGGDALAEAWWEEEGTIHRSYLIGGGDAYGGGDFEAKRYLKDDNYICESMFHRSSGETVTLTWTFARNEQ